MLPARSEQELVLGRYQLGSRIGAGAMGSVFRAIEPSSGQEVVVKFFDGQEDGFSSWASEMRLALRFRHRNIVACLDMGFDERQRLWALVFAQAKGGSLRRAIASGRRFSGRQLGQVLLDIASALAYAHAQGVVHRDVKPENILAQAAGEDSIWLLTDFGSGRFLAKGEVARSLAGSLQYMAPEVMQQSATAASDQFSLGVVGLELWLGRLPSSEERPALAERLRSAAGLLGAIGRLVQIDPGQRFADMAEVVNRLREELIEMENGGDIIAILRRYLSERLNLPRERQQQLLVEWAHNGPFVEFLVHKGLLPRALARTLEAVRSGYVDMSVESILGIAGGPHPGSIPDDEASAALHLAEPAPTTQQQQLLSGSERPPLLPAEAPAPPLASRAAPSSVSLPEPAAASSADATLPTAPPPPRTATASSPRQPKAMPGQRLGRYILQEPLGDGATATVFRSFHDMLSIPVAIKVFAPLDPAEAPEEQQRFLYEAQTLIRLEHPHIVRVLDVDISQQMPFIVMEYVGEMTLASQIRNLGHLPQKRIAQIGIAVADALEAAAREGLMHRDVKPSNIIERRDGHIKLVDFGIAVKRTPEGALNDPQAALGLVSGTPSYIAPEQAQDPSGIDYRADMYALGATLYHAAVGRPAFVRDTAYDTIVAQTEEEATPLRQLDPSFDPNLAAVIHRMMRKQREERYTSWAEVKEALTHALHFHDQPEVSITMPGPPPCELTIGSAAAGGADAPAQEPRPVAAAPFGNDPARAEQAAGRKQELARLLRRPPVALAALQKFLMRPWRARSTSERRAAGAALALLVLLTLAGFLRC